MQILLQGAPKSNLLGKCDGFEIIVNFFRHILLAYKGGFRSHILQIFLQYLLASKNYLTI